MCGIAGIIAPAAYRLRPNLERMLGALRHRGPDDSGICEYENCLLGHRRLSIVDLAAGKQPMLSPVGRRAVVFNGEIYGYRDLRERLEFPFATHSDTEVLLALYHAYGNAMLPHLPGMFAFAIWDEERRTLFAARDRAGEKPFYYAIGTGGEFLFASEISALIASGLVRPQLDPEIAGHFLRKLYVPPDRCIYKNVHSLPPAHALEWQSQQTRTHRYWTVPEIRSAITPHEAVEEFSARLRGAVSRQMVADVPVGAFLSGGLDSSTLVALAAETHPKLHTFSFGFGERIDELPYARAVARQYDTLHREREDHTSEPARTLLDLQPYCDEPIGDSAVIPLHLLCRMAREEVKVAIAGEGADELLAGYRYLYDPLRKMEAARSKSGLQRVLLRILAGLAARFLPRQPQALSDYREGNALLSGHRSLSNLREAYTSVFRREDVTALGLVSAVEPAGGPDSLDRMLVRDVETSLPGDILTKTDRASMATSLEVRCPFLDRDVLSWCLSVPSALKIDQQRDKILLREAFSPFWPEAIRTRSKQGFGAPVKQWLEWPSFQELIHSVLRCPGSRIYEHISFGAAQPYLAENSHRTWALLVLGLWMEHWKAA